MMTKKLKLVSILRIRSHKRKVSVFLLLILLCETISPTATLALTGGPSQPEVQSFEPIGTSEMVNLFSGDFNYNIPLLDMDGYPINMSYHSGITMDQEASWVGLGWNINPGVINRSMRGVPDDFKGEEIKKELNVKPNRTFGVNGGFDGEVFGFDELGFSGLNFSLGIKYNNYTGMGLEQSVTTPLTSGANSYGSYTSSLGISSSSDEGLTIQPEVSLDAVQKKTEAESGSTTKSLGLTVGTGFNSRAGLTYLSVSPYTKTTNKIADALGNERTASEVVTPKANAKFNLGMPTYTPSVTMPMMNFSLNANFKLGGELTGLHGNVMVGGYFSTQRLFKNEIKNPAYGYLYSESGQHLDNAIHDFNREKDGSFTKYTPALHLTNYTYDVYALSGQGIGGSYRPFRNEMAYVYDAEGYSFSNGDGFGAEIGFGDAVHDGYNLSVTYTGTRSGKWEIRNKAIPKLQFQNPHRNSLLENVNFAEANEKVVDADPSYFDNYGGFEAQRFILNKKIPFNHGLQDKLKGSNGTITLPSTNYKGKRNKRNQSISTLTRQELDAGLGLELPQSSANAQPHHIAQITSNGTDGMRYVYGIAAYNTTQEEVTFATGANLYGNEMLTPDCATGLVNYGNSDDSKENNRGLDNYFSRTTTPAYAHAYLLTSVLSPDYSDADNIPGASIGDIGNYTKFNYVNAVPDFNWRTPVGDHMASYNEGLKTIQTDNKGSYVYGKKELWYLTSIESKNYIAIFQLEDRQDALGVVDREGAIDNTKTQKLLRKISLYTLRDYYSNILSKTLNPTAIPLKEVHFEYDYSSCLGVPNSSNGGGKLTLKKVYFTYQKSDKARLSPYSFKYSTTNPTYNLKNYDRWGNYKEGSTSCGYLDPLTTAEFPYSVQDTAIANFNASAWTLTQIKLPSGGKINVKYESDDYAYVQHMRAMQMYQIVGTSEDPANIYTGGERQVKAISSGILPPNSNRHLYVKVDPAGYDPNEYFKGVQQIYFRCLTNMSANADPDAYDYVSGYSKGHVNGAVNGHPDVLDIELDGVTMNDNGFGDYNPITKAAIQFGRLNLSRYFWGTPGISENDNFGEQLLNTLIGSNPFKTIKDAALGPNLAKYTEGRGTKIITNKSWLRLNNPSYKKNGGGSRVKSIQLSDEWDDMTSSVSQLPKSVYGQIFDYTLEDGKSSSGVASYEPQLGGDENPWREPVQYSDHKFLSPDDRFYQEKPYGESFFPSPSVGYSRVTVRNITGQNVTRHGSGKVVHEFYTAKDFPTLVEKTDLEVNRQKLSPFGLGKIFKVKSKDHMAATQGFKIETNDMHGKQKSQKVYQQGSDDPITSVEYFYKSSPHAFETNTQSTMLADNTRILDNDATVIYPNGNTGNARLGVFYDMVSDMRQSRSETTSASIPFNSDGFVAAIVPIYIALIIPGFGKEVVQFRSASTTKVIQRFAILDKVVAKDLGSSVATANLAYDAETGEVLATQTTTDFNDKIYTLNYPAHWYYDGMGPAYKNIGYELDNTVSGGVLSNITFDPRTIFTLGDEVSLGDVTLGNVTKAWVTGLTSNSATFEKKDGTPASGGPIKIIRSGRKNMQVAKVASITTLSNPLNNFSSNIFQNVLQASAIEFSDNWRTFCDCFENNDISQPFSSNPYVLGTKGNWRPVRSWLHLSKRSQSYESNNSNIRKDGVFTSFTPFYSLNSGTWNKDERNWTFTSQVTEFSPFGQELENKDALGRYSAATFGYRQSMATAVAANTKYRELGSDNFEDYGFSPCADNHFKFTSNVANINSTQSHTGRNSIKVNSSSPVIMTRNIASACSPAPCNISIAILTQGSTTTYTPSGGSGIYSFNWDIVNGEPAINLDPSGALLQVAGTGYTMILTIMDSNGCKTTQTITSANNVSKLSGN